MVEGIKLNYTTHNRLRYTPPFRGGLSRIPIELRDCLGSSLIPFGSKLQLGVSELRFDDLYTVVN